MPPETITETDPDQHDGVGHQHEALSHAIDHPAQGRFEEDAEDRSDNPQFGDGLGRLMKNLDQHQRAEGDEDLLAGAEEKSQDVVQPVGAVPDELRPRQVGAVTAIPPVPASASKSARSSRWL